MKNNEELEKIIAAVKKLPVINNKTDKTALYHRISSKMVEGQEVQPRKKTKIVPILATVMVVVLLAIIPFMLNDDSNQQVSQYSDHEVTTTLDLTEESRTSESSDEQEAGSVENEMDNQEESLDHSDEIHVAMKASIESHVISVEEERLLVYGAIADTNMQYVIPISFIVEESTDVHEYYNKLATYMQEDDWNTADYLLEGVSFQLNEADKEVLVGLEDGFSLGEGSTNAYIFEKTLATMFTPLGIEKAVFQNGIDLGPIGLIEEMPLHEEEVLYKLYNNTFLIPIPTKNELTIEEAIGEMNQNDPDFNVAQTIPDQIHFDVHSTGNLLELTFLDDPEYLNEQEVLTMIEAILMTAKSYGFERVQFQNPPLQQVNRYNLTEPINVPQAANPIDLR